MTSPAEALEVMAVVAACHARTAPRMDDLEAVKATATVWAELFNAKNLKVDELIAAVKSRATMFSDAPEPADIIRVAISARQDRSNDPQRAVEPSYGVPCIPEASQYSHLPNRTPRLIAAQDALGWSQGGDESRAAIREYQAALAEYRGKPMTVAEAPLIPDVAAVVTQNLPAVYEVPAEPYDTSEPRHPRDEIASW